MCTYGRNRNFDQVHKTVLVKNIYILPCNTTTSPSIFQATSGATTDPSNGGGGASRPPPPPPPPLLCPRVPHNFDPLNPDLVTARYNSTRESLFLDFADLLHKFCDGDVYNTSVAGAFR